VGDGEDIAELSSSENDPTDDVDGTRDSR
jgi:hypothetical protein